MSEKAIGGYFGLELSPGYQLYHNKAIALNSGRNALEFILNHLEIERLLIPYYTCDVTLQALKRNNVKHEFYHINNDFEPIITVELKPNDALLYVNYFGISNYVVDRIIPRYKSKLIIDNSQAFFEKHDKNVSTFYSPRKFFGVPDGGFCYVLDERIDINIDKEHSYDKCSHLLKRKDTGAESGYIDFQINEKKLDNIPIRRMSSLTTEILKSIDFEFVKEKRIENFKHIHNALKDYNELSDNIKNSNYIPMIYPFLRKGNESLRKNLIENKIFIAKYWDNVPKWTKEADCFEMNLYNNLLPLPVDHRYSLKDMERVVRQIKRTLRL